ncbi:hypothetical protein CsSME_00001653 [Camellia sinensis var. sinensis]
MTHIAVMGLSNRTMPKFMTWLILILFVFVTYIIYTLNLVSSNSRSYDDDPIHHPPTAASLLSNLFPSPSRSTASIRI